MRMANEEQVDRVRQEEDLAFLRQEEQVDRLRQGAESWNAWRLREPDARPTLSGLADTLHHPRRQHPSKPRRAG